MTTTRYNFENDCWEYGYYMNRAFHVLARWPNV